MKVTTFRNREENQLLQLVVDGERLKFATLKGGAATFLDFLFCLKKVEMLKNILLKCYRRDSKNYEFVTKQGMSGCRDYYIRWQNSNGFIHRKKVLHISMYKALNEGVDIWEGDLQQLIFQNPELADALPQLCEKKTHLDMYPEENIDFNHEIDHFDCPASNWLYLLTHEGEDVIENYPVCKAFWQLIGGKEGYDAFYNPSEDEEEEA